MVHCVSSRICACFEKERCGLSTFCWIKFALYMSLCGAYIVLLLQIESYYFKVFIYMLYLAYSSHSSGHLLDTSSLYKLYCTRLVPMVCCAFLSTWCTWCTVHDVETSIYSLYCSIVAALRLLHSLTSGRSHPNCSLGTLIVSIEETLAVVILDGNPPPFHCHYQTISVEQSGLRDNSHY